ncbi:MAG: hypothetical protein V4579_04190 [Pseudomonadota bacterium]
MEVSSGVPAADAVADILAPADGAPQFARILDWITSSSNNLGLPFMIVDKKAARVFLFDAKGKALKDAPVLLGRATGDIATPGVGVKSLSEIGPAEKTTPAGRFLAKMGRAGGGQRVLWVDYATSVAIHTIPNANKEQRVKRMLSPEIDDNRITFGCINVPKTFYNTGIRRLFTKKGGYVYVLPDTEPVEVIFPLVRLYPETNVASSGQ